MRAGPSFLLCAVLCLSFSLGSIAQQPAVQPRITQAIDESTLTVLRGNTPPLALARYDRGTARPSLPMQRMLLVLKRSPEQDAGLLRLLDEQQDKSSPNYHKWLTPEQFGKQFGPADGDIQTVTSWLASHGFQVARVSKGRTVIEFSGTAAMVQEAFHTAIHNYVVGGERHQANASDPQIPSALASVVAGVASLHNFHSKPQIRVVEQSIPARYKPGSPPEVNFGGTPPRHALGPADFYTIYNALPLITAGKMGTGVKIAVLGRTDININDVFDFFGIFLSSFSPGPVLVSQYNDGPDPGDLGGGEEAEAVLDTSWSLALAPNAAITLVVSASTDTTDGVELSELYIVDNDLADIMTDSFGSCEAQSTLAHAQSLWAMGQQAAAEGITHLVATGDTGASGCDNLGETVATGPISVNVLASTAYNVAVGGTVFNENGQDSTYWSANNQPNSFASALKYIPENVWNDSCTSASCGNNANIAAGGGGASGTNASFQVPKPSWQAGVAGIPADGARDLPDVSLTAAVHDPYLVCLQSSCVPDAQGFIHFAGIGGTSASTPSFAGIMALVDQSVGGRVGLANYVLYKLAGNQSQYPGQCNGSNTSAAPNAACIFNDITKGNNAVPGQSSMSQYTSAAGYDLASGLGSVNVNNLVTGWAAATFTGTHTTLTLNPQTGILHGSKVTVDVTVNPTSGSAKPTGSVSLLANAGSPPNGGVAVDQFSLNAGIASWMTQLLPGGTSMITAHYPGDGTFGASDSAPISVTVNPEPSTTTLKVLTTDSVGNPVPFTGGPYGSFIYVRADVSGSSGFGTPTGTVTFSDQGTNFATPALNSQGNTNTSPSGNSAFTPGSHSITATYNGDASFHASSPSSPVSLSITKAATITSVQSNPTTAPSGSMVTLTATVNTASVGNSPTGNVMFFNGNTQLPGSASLSGGLNSTTGYTQGIATYQTSALPNGQNTITAQYTDDSNYTGSTSSAITVNVAIDFSMAFTGSTGTVMTISAPGGSGSLTLSVTGQPGYNGTVTFAANACQGLPATATCSFNPPSVTGSGNTTVTVRTVASHSNLFPRGTVLNAWAAGGGLTLAGIFVLGVGPRKRRWTSLACLLLVAWLMTVVGCSGGGGGGGGSTIGTPPGSYPIVVSGSDGNFTHPVNFTLLLQ
jgi:hypothetical protein